MFEPEFEAGDREAGDSGGLVEPLRMVLQNRGHMEMFCTQPLVVDFLSRRFNNGLPNLVGTNGVLNEENKMIYLAHGAALCRCMVINVQDKTEFMNFEHILDTLLSPCLMLQGVRPGEFNMTETSLSILPGAQFLAAGLVAMPDAYYWVPAMRMA